MTPQILKPINPNWVSLSIVWGEVALCRDENGVLWFCTWKGESEGWNPAMVATKHQIEAFQWSQRLAGKTPEPWPE